MPESGVGPTLWWFLRLPDFLSETPMTFMLGYKTRLQWAGLLLPAVAALCASGAVAAVAPVANPSTELSDTKARARAVEYSVINLGPEGATTVLNQRDQAAFAIWSSDEIFNGFFDGRRVHALGSLGGS